MTNFHQNGRLKKTEFFKIAISQNFFVKISQIGPCVSRIDWCEGHWCGSTYMALNPTDSWIKLLCSPCIGWGCVSQESIAANEKDDIRTAQGWDVLKPEKLNIEFVKEVSVDEHSHAEEEVAHVRDKNQRLPSCSVAPGSKEECKDDTGNLEDRWVFDIKAHLFDQDFISNLTCLIKLETISTLATTVCTYSCSSEKVPLKRLSHTWANWWYC